MAKTVQVVSIDFNKTEIKGKSVDQIIIVLKNLEKNTDKKEFIPSFNKVYSAAAVLSVGDICEATWTKKTVGDKDYFNLTELTKTSSGEVAPAATGYTAKATPGYSGATKSSYGTKDPETQQSICRQNANTAAVNFVTNLLTNKAYPAKSTPDMLFAEVQRFAKKIEAYVTLKDDYTQMGGVGEVLPADDGDGMLD
jgi:hypothetical protein